MNIEMMKKITASISLLVIALFLTGFYQLLGGYSDSGIKLIVRGDDMGITHATNVAILEAYKRGIQKTAEVIVPAPWFPEAAAMLRSHPELDAGVHLTLTSEWEGLKWGPLTHSPSLMDEDGYFYPMIWPNEHYGKNEALKSQRWKLEEIEQEFRAQITLAKKHIPHVSHLSYHMGCNNLSPQVDSLVYALAGEFNLDIDLEENKVQRVRFEGPHETTRQKISSFNTLLKGLEPGTYLYIGHPSLDTSEMQAIRLKGNDRVAADRQGITDLYTSEQIKKLIKKLNVELISYADLAE